MLLNIALTGPLLDSKKELCNNVLVFIGTVNIAFLCQWVGKNNLFIKTSKYSLWDVNILVMVLRIQATNIDPSLYII